jgi:hypothetical protein
LGWIIDPAMGQRRGHTMADGGYHSSRLDAKTKWGRRADKYGARHEAIALRILCEVLNW